jgi:Di-haem oxidoreductase, putative peroxidase
MRPASKVYLRRASHRVPAISPSLTMMPFHQAGAVVSLRQFTNNAFTHHHGMQSEERFGIGVDEDGDGFVNELTRADITAVTVYQATLPVPGRVIPADPEAAKAARIGEVRFLEIGCAACHIPALPLDNRGWVYSEPNPITLRAISSPGRA